MQSRYLETMGIFATRPTGCIKNTDLFSRKARSTFCVCMWHFPYPTSKLKTVILNSIFCFKRLWSAYSAGSFELKRDCDTVSEIITAVLKILNV